MATTEHDEALRSVLGTVAPGTELRDGLERILRGNTGALIVIGWDRSVEELCTGGFPLDVEFSPTQYEVAYRPMAADGSLGGEVKFSHNVSTTAVS